MSIPTDNAAIVLQNHAKAVFLKYNARWKPSEENIREAVSLFIPSMGIGPYDLEDIIERQRVFWKSKEEFVLKCNHNFSVFTKHSHRWVLVPAKIAPASHLSSGAILPNGGQASPERCPDCGQELLPGEICEKCFPHCSECGCQHAATESCNEFAQREAALKKMFGQSEGERIKKIKSIGDFLK
jgi:hypothetical protein